MIDEEIDFLIIFFATFIYFTSHRELDEVYINSSWWLKPVILDSAYIWMCESPALPLCLDFLMYLTTSICSSISYQSINQSINFFLIKCYIINALSTVQWNTHKFEHIHIHIQWNAAHIQAFIQGSHFGADTMLLFQAHTFSHSWTLQAPAPSLFLVIHL